MHISTFNNLSLVIPYVSILAKSMINYIFVGKIVNYVNNHKSDSI